MSCERFERALIDHACGAPMPAEVAAHVAGCAACQARLDGERRLMEDVEQAIRRELRITASPGFSARVSAGGRAMPPAGIGIDMRWVAAAACTALAFGMFATLHPERAIPLPPPAAPLTGSVAPSAVPDPNVTAAPPDGTEARVTSRSPEPPRTARAGRRPAPSADAPPREVIVPPTQLQAIARLRELVARGALDEEILPPQNELGSPPADLAIAPLAIPEIIIPDVGVVTGAAAVLHTPEASKESL